MCVIVKEEKFVIYNCGRFRPVYIPHAYTCVYVFSIFFLFVCGTEVVGNCHDDKSEKRMTVKVTTCKGIYIICMYIVKQIIQSQCFFSSSFSVIHLLYFFSSSSSRSNCCCYRRNFCCSTFHRVYHSGCIEGNFVVYMLHFYGRSIAVVSFYSHMYEWADCVCVFASLRLAFACFQNTKLTNAIYSCVISYFVVRSFVRSKQKFVSNISSIIIYQDHFIVGTYFRVKVSMEKCVFVYFRMSVCVKRKIFFSWRNYIYSFLLVLVFECIFF